MYEWLIHFHIFFWWMEDFFLCWLSTGISNQADLIKREKPFERKPERDIRKQEGSFSFSCLEYSLFLKLPSVWKAHPPSPSSKLLNFFSSRLTSPQAHTVRVTRFSSTMAPPPSSHWLFYSLIPATAPSSPFSSPLLFFSFFSSVLVTHTNQLTAKGFLCPCHADRTLNQNWDISPEEDIAQV